jgi:hypothetical protein
MPAGCDFVCKNSNCLQVNKGFTITGPWPMGDIDEVINNTTDQPLLQHLEQKKKDGCKIACISFPNTKGIKTLFNRVSLWSQEARCVWQYDIDVNTALERAKLPDICERTGCELKSFMDVVEDGVDCPFCGEKMNQIRWSTREV